MANGNNDRDRRRALAGTTSTGVAGAVRRAENRNSGLRRQGQSGDSGAQRPSRNQGRDQSRSPRRGGGQSSRPDRNQGRDQSRSPRRGQDGGQGGRPNRNQGRGGSSNVRSQGQASEQPEEQLTQRQLDRVAATRRRATLPGGAPDTGGESVLEMSDEDINAEIAAGNISVGSGPTETQQQASEVTRGEGGVPTVRGFTPAQRQAAATADGNGGGGRQQNSNFRGVAASTPGQVGPLPPTSEGVTRTVTNDGRNADGPARVTLRTEDGQGGTGQISFDAGASQRARERLRREGVEGVLPNTPTMNMNPSANAGLAPGQRERVQGNLRQAGAEQEQSRLQQINDRMSRLRRQADTRLSGSMTPGEFQRAQLRRNNAQSELQRLAEERQNIAEQQLEERRFAEQRRENQFNRGLEQRDQRLQEIEFNDNLSQQERENRQENVDRAFDRAEQLATGPEGEVNQQRFEEISSFVSNIPAEDLNKQTVDRTNELLETMEGLNDAAETSSARTFLQQATNFGAGVASGIGSIYLMAKAPATLGTSAVPAAGLGALSADQFSRAFSSGETPFPNFDDPQTTLSALQELKEKGVRRERRTPSGSNVTPFKSEVIQWRGQDVNLGALPENVQQRLARMVDLAPDVEEGSDNNE